MTEMSAWHPRIFLICLSMWLVEIPSASKAFLPNTPKKPVFSFNPNDVGFYLFPDRSNMTFQQEIVYGDVASLKRSGLIPNSPLRMYIHGATLNVTTGGCIPLKDAFLKEKYTNFMCVDWGKLSTPNRDYIPKVSPIPVLDGIVFPAIIKTSKVASRRIADFLIFLKKQKFLKNYGDVHLMALSLGTHVAAGVGSFIQADTTGRIGRITAFDPSSIYHDEGVIPARFVIGKDKAEFVDVIHTDAGYFGTVHLLGHIDFFPNGGRTVDQPACAGFVNLIGACGHRLALDYYERVILGEDLRGCRCKFRLKAPIKQPCPKPKNCKLTVKMGFPVPKSSYGSYYVTVPENPPPGTHVAREYEPFNFTLFSVD